MSAAESAARPAPAAATVTSAELDLAAAAHLVAVRHDLRSPVSSMIGYLELLDDARVGPLTDKQRRYLGNVLQASREFLGLIDEMVDLCRLDVATRPEWRIVDPAAAVIGACEALRGPAEARSVEIQVERSGDGHQTIGDARLLLQASFHLLRLAVRRARPETTVRVSIGARAGSFSVAIGCAADLGERELEAVRTFAGDLTPEMADRTTQALLLSRRIVLIHGGITRSAVGPDGALDLGFELPSAG